MSQHRAPQEITSLTGKIRKQSMGQKASKDKPKKSSRAGTQSVPLNAPFKPANILEQRFDDTVVYRPRTKQNKLVYENFLGRIHEIVQDQPPQILISICDEILAIVKSDTPEPRKKADCEDIIGCKFPLESFIDICNLLQNITDYSVEEGITDGIVHIQESEQEEEGVEEEQIIEEDEEVEVKEQIHHKMEVEQPEGVVHLETSTIDAHWLQSELMKHYEASQVLPLQREIMNILNIKSNLEVENGLLTLLNYQRYQLIKLLLENRRTIYYCIRYHQSQHDKDKQHLLEEMKIHNITLGKKPKRVEKNTVQQITETKDQDEETSIKYIGKDEEINKINKKVIDLSLHETDDRIKKEQEYKFKLPEGAERIEKVGYQEVYIPPRTKKIHDQLIEIDTLPMWMQGAFEGVKRLNPIQSKVFEHALHSDGNMLVCAPTSSGKTNIALMTILEVISHYRDENEQIDLTKFKVVYIAPMKALVAQITGNLSNRLKGFGVTVKELTGDMHLTKAQIQDTQIIVSTPEKWDIITRKAGDRLFVEKVKLLIIDQIHLLSDGRGPVLESIIARTIRQVQLLRQQTRIVGLSATLPNYKDVGAVLRAKKEGVFYFDQSYRPIPLEQRFIGVTEKKGVRKMLMVNQILYEKVMERVTTQQMIIFVHSRRDTARTAQIIYETALAKNELNRIMKTHSQSKKMLEAIVEKETINSKELKQLLVHGIGIHHAGLSRADRDLVEQLFADRHFNILVSTATLAWGVNLPAHTVIIKGTQIYSAEEGKWIQLSMQDVMQMLGRAGRPRFDEEGQGMIITGYEQVRYYLNLLNMQIPLQSQMLRSICDQINAEVVSGSVSSIREGVNWLSYTYLFIRMLKNPRYYSIPIEEIEEDKELIKRRVNIVHSAFTVLERNGLINYDRKNGTVSTTFLGKTASYYYIKYPSMAIYNSNLKMTSGLIELFKIFAMSIQFKFLHVREEEKNQLKKLVETVPVPIKGSTEDATTKIAALLQAHISRLQLEGFALNIDKVYVTQSASRIMRALFQICLKRNWGQATQRTLELAKMIDRSMWSCLNPLRQFKEIPQYVLSRLQKKEQFSWESFYQMTPQEIGQLTKFPKLGKILHKFVHHVPRAELTASAQPLTRSCLRIELKVKADFKSDDSYHGKEQPFWLFVLDCNEQTILYSCYFTLERNTQYATQFIVPLFEVMHPLYFIKVISDRWICSQNILPLSFKNMILPSKFAASMDLLDLQPLPFSSLLPIGKQLRITQLNQIQTQTYNSFVHSTHNIFLGAAQGSGKFTLAVFAMVSVLQENRKVVVIVSHSCLLSKKHALLTKVFPKKKVGHTLEELSKNIEVLSSMDVVVSTAQAWDVLSRRWKARKGFNEIGLVVVDNLHLLETNGSILEVVVSRMRCIASESEFRLIGLSTSLADYKEVSEWLGVPSQNSFNFHLSVRVNPVQVIFHSTDQYIRQSRLQTMQRQFMQAVIHYNRPALAVVSDKKQARLTALDFVSQLSLDTNPKRLKKVNDMSVFFKKINDHFLMHVLEYGVGYIYEGMNQVEREIVERLFQIEGIGLLICTHSVKWQLETKVFLVGVLDCSYYESGQWKDYSIAEMLQLMGLSALTNKNKEYQSSKFMIFCHSSRKAFYKKFLFEPYPLESSLNRHLPNHLSTSIVSKFIESKEDCIDWLTWTLMYRRLIHNPNYYNMEDISEEGISTYLSELVESTVDYLSEIKCVEVEGQMGLTPTNFGIICSYYYIRVETIGRFISQMSQAMKMKDLIELVSQACELEQFTYRPKEYDVVGQLLVRVNEKAKNKAHGLMLLHFYRLELPSELLSDLKLMLPICVKLAHTLVDVISTFAFLRPLIVCMQFSQMIVQGMWVDDLPLMQIMDGATAKLLHHSYNIKDFNDFVDMEEQERKKALKGKDIEKIASACNRFPVITLSYEVLSVEEEMKIKVKLERDEELEDDKVLSSCYPGDKEQAWWVVVGEKKTNKVLVTRKTQVKRTAELLLSVETQGVDKMVVYALCDSYIGRDQAEEILQK